MLGFMQLFFDSFWRALTYCFRSRVIVLSLMPLVLMLVLAFGLTYLFWQPALQAVREAFDASLMLGSVGGGFQAIGLTAVTAFLAPLALIFAVTPIIVVLSLLAVALLMAPALTELVASRRFDALERKNGGTLLGSLSWSLWSTVLALVALVVSVPLWLVPPLILVLPPLIWGWLTYRVMAFDALAAHASVDERKQIFHRHRMVLLLIGVVCGFMGAAPSVIWASGVLFAAAFVVLIPFGIWLYTLVFALSSLWFAHYCLAALAALRNERTNRTDRRTPVAPAQTADSGALADEQALTLPYDDQPKPDFHPAH